MRLSLLVFSGHITTIQHFTLHVPGKVKSPVRSSPSSGVLCPGRVCFPASTLGLYTSDAKVMSIVNQCTRKAQYVLKTRDNLTRMLLVIVAKTVHVSVEFRSAQFHPPLAFVHPVHTPQ